LKRAIYPGSFDLITNGHLDVVRRALEVFDSLVVAVAVNPKKVGFFTYDERVDLIREVTTDLARVEVVTFQGLLVDYCREHGLTSVIRGLRAVSDFDYEFQMHTMNKRLNPALDTFFMMTSEEYFYLSSNLVREVSAFGGDISGLVDPRVEARIKRKLEENRAR
jgi:pantetheine-phosphate adenylyltransferase